MLATKRKRILSLFLALVMILGLLPVSALAASDPLKPSPIGYNENGSAGQGPNAPVVLSKQAERTGPDTWNVTLNVKLNDIQIEQQPLEVTFVLDTSGSMAWCTTQEGHQHGVDCDPTCGRDEHPFHSSFECYKVCTRQDNPSHYSYNWRTRKYEHNDWGTDCEKLGNGRLSYYAYLDCPYDGLHTHTSSCYKDCQIPEHIHSGGTACSNVDASHPSRLDAAKGSLTSMMNTLRANLGDQVTIHLVTFASDANTVADDKLQETLNSVKASGSTNLTAGVNTGIDQFSSNDTARKVLVVLADGDADYNIYPTSTATNFKNSGGIIYTVGFLFSNQNFNALATQDGKHNLTCGSDKALNEAMQSIATNISAMIWDPMGPDVSVVPGTAHIDVDLEMLTVTSDRISWYPDDTKLGTGGVSSVTLTYTVKLKDSAKTLGTHTSVPLNTGALLQYKVVKNNQSGAIIDAAFPLPLARYSVGSLTTSHVLEAGGNVPGLPEPATQTVISDWDNAVFTRAKAPATVDAADPHQRYLLKSSAYDGAALANSADGISADDEAHTLVHTYGLETVYAVKYQYTGQAPDGAPAPPDGGVYPAGSAQTVAANPTMAKYSFSGWSAENVIPDAAGRFTLTGDVTFTGAWELKPTYEVVANFYTDVDGVGAAVPDNGQTPHTLMTEAVGDYQTYQAPDTQTYGSGTYTLNGKPVITTDPANNKHTILTLEYRRDVATQVEYTVKHEYFVRTDGALAPAPEAVVTDPAHQGDHGAAITASDYDRTTNGNYTYTVLDRSGDITLDKDAEAQQITIRYVRDRYTVSASLVDENGKPSTDGTISGAGTYDKGASPNVAWRASEGYQVVSVTVDSASYQDGSPKTFESLSDGHAVVVTIAPIPYQLHVKYDFPDGGKPASFADYTDRGVYHIRDAYAVVVPEAPAGYTFDSSASSPASGTFPAHDVTVKLVYHANERASATVRFLDGSGGPLQDAGYVTVLAGQFYDVSACQDQILNVNGKRYQFTGDDTDIEAGPFYSGTMPAGGVVITRYYELVEPVNVVYDPGEHGAFEQAAYPAYSGEATPEYTGSTTGETGWVFNGWSPAVNATVSENGDTYTAQWKSMPRVTVQYALWTSHNGGAPANPVYVTIVDNAPVAMSEEYSHTAPGTYEYTGADGNTLKFTLNDSNNPQAWSADEMAYNATKTLTFNFVRNTYGAVNYTVNHVYRTYTGDAAVETVDGTDPETRSGIHSSTIRADELSKRLTYGGNTYAYDHSDPASITLAGGDEISLYYNRYQFNVSFDGDEGIASYTGAGTYGKGAAATVGWTLNTGYRVRTVTVNDTTAQGVSGNSVTLSALTADQQVKVTTEKIPYLVTYYLNGAPYGEAVTQYHGDTLTMKNPPALGAGERFGGWQGFVPTMPNHDLEIFGTTSLIGYTIVYVPGEHGTFDTQSHTATYGSTTPAFQGEKTGETNWVFDGWTPEVAGTVSGDATYTAQWREATYTVQVVHVDGADGQPNRDMLTAQNVTGVQVKVGESYTPAPAANLPEGYRVADGQPVVTGDAVAGGTVTYTYTYVPLGSATLTVNYNLVDEDGGFLKTLETTGTVIHPEGYSYSLTAKDITGYTSLGLNAASPPASGTLAKGQDAVVTFDYAANRYPFRVDFINDYTGAKLETYYADHMTAVFGTAMTNADVAPYLGGAPDSTAWQTSRMPADYALGRVAFPNPVGVSAAGTYDAATNTWNSDAVTNIVEVHYTYTPPVTPPPGPTTTPDDNTEGYPDGYDPRPTPPPVENIPEEPVPLEPTPDIPEIVIPEPEVPLGDLPEGEEEIVIEDGEVPLGDLPQTGAVASPVNPTITYGLLALALSLAGAGLAICITRRKDEEEDA